MAMNLSRKNQESAGMTPVPAEAVKNIRNVVGRPMDDPKSTCSLTSSKNSHLSSGGLDLSALLFSGPKAAG